MLLRYSNNILISSLACIFLILLLAGCNTSRNGNFFSFKGMPKPPTEGPPEYIAGWEDGCQTGMTAYSTTMLRTFHTAQVNAPMMSNTNYNKGWRLGNRYCNYYTSRYLSMGYFDDDSFSNSDLRSDNTWFGDTNSFNALFRSWPVQEAYNDKHTRTHGLFNSGGTHGLFPDGSSKSYGLF